MLTAYFLILLPCYIHFLLHFLPIMLINRSVILNDLQLILIHSWVINKYHLLLKLYTKIDFYASLVEIYI